MKNVEIEGAVNMETEKAIRVTINGCRSSCWLPKSQLKNLKIAKSPWYEGDKICGYDTFFSAEIPVWLWNKLPLNDGPIPYATAPY